MSEHTNRNDQKPPSVDRLSLLWHRINDHKMVQWSVAYVALAYGIQHGVVLTSEAFDWPHAVVSISMLLLALGLPLVMTFAWYHGERASRQFTKAELSILAALLVMSSLLFYAFVRPSEEVATGPRPGVQQASVTPSTNAANVVSIAVLPFVNLSSEKEQEFFSDGMTEEITSALAKVPNLRVVGRTSAFQFKGENRDLRAIGLALSATHLIEGSVRKDGNEVRITAQLIKVDDGTHLWTESYNRELKGIFAMQEDIAVAISGALRVPLGLQQGEHLVSNRTLDPESYQQYLRARALFRARSAGAREGTIEILEPVVARNPSYAPAWALMAQAYEARETDKAEKAAREAIRLDSRNALGYAVLSDMQTRRGNVAAAEDLQKQALALDPDDTDVLDSISNGWAVHGRVKESVKIREKLRTLEPFVPVYNYITASIMLNNGQSQAAITVLKELPSGDAGGNQGPRFVTLARAYAAEGRYGEAADTLLAIPGADQKSRKSIEEAAQLLRKAPRKVSTPATLPALDFAQGELGFVYVYVGAPNRVLDYPERLAAADGLSAQAVRYLWSSEFAPVRKTERFKALMRTAGFVDYWRARGWPDHCHPVGANDFACD
jgi:TolB-like protein